MTPPDLIRADYPILETIATTFDDQRDRVQQLRESVSRHVSGLKSGGWVSDAADSFYREMDDDLLPSLQRLMTALGTAGDTTRRIMKLLHDAEQEAAAAMKGSDNTADEGSGVADVREAVPPVSLPRGFAGRRKGRHLPVRYSPLFQEETPEPPVPASEEQLTALTDLGIVIPADAALTTDEAQVVLDFYAEHEQGLLAEGMSFADVQRAIAIIQRVEDTGFGVGLSPYNPKPWRLTDLEHLSNSTEEASQTTYDQFLAQFEDPEAAQAALALIAEELGVNTDDAALRLFFSPQGIAFSFLRDAGVNIYDNAQGDSTTDTVGYTNNNPENPLEVYRAFDGEYTDEAGNVHTYTIVYDPTPVDPNNPQYVVYDSFGQVPPEYVVNGLLAPNNAPLRDTIIADTERNAGFYGWYRGNDVILADNVLSMGEESRRNYAIGGVFTAEALILHEQAHAVDNANSSLSGSLDTNTAGLTYQAGTRYADNERRADIIMNGLLGTIITDEQQANYDAYISRVLDENFTSLTGMSISEFEAGVAESEVTPEATEPPPDSEATPDAPNI